MKSAASTAIHFIAQEYVAGQNLKQWLARHGTADARTAVHIMRQVVAALSRASQQGIIHRDIKPENIMLAKTGEVKVADFGLARVTTDGQAVNLTQVGVTMGTPLYMSPEQVEGRAVDPRSDLYSFGVTSFEMLAGRPPFEGETPLSVAVQHLRTEPERLENLRPDLPEGLCRIVHRLLAKSPAERFQTTAEVMRDLRALQIEGLEQWPAGIDEWDAPDLLAFSEGRSQATMRLEAVMRSQSVVSRRRVLGVWVGAALAGGLLLGAAGAAFSRPAYLLDELPARRSNARRRPNCSIGTPLKLNTEEAWLTVERYFPQDNEVNRVYAWQAKQRLAEFYRENHQPDKAMQLYSELAASKEIQFAAQGLVGKANLLYEQGKKELATAELGAAATLLAQLPQDEQIRSVLQWLDPDLRVAFMEVASDVERLEKLPPESMFE